MSESLSHNTPILIVAANASATFGGEAVLPLHYFRVLRERGYAVTLLTHERNRESLEDIFGVGCHDIVLMPDTIWHKILWRISIPFPYKVSEFFFGTFLNLLSEHLQARKIRLLVAQGKARLIHQPTPVSPRLPSSLYGFGIPVIIGPMNGGMAYPPGYSDFETGLERRFVSVANKLSGFLNKLVPGKARADMLLVANKRTQDALPLEHPQVVMLAENGVDFNMFDPETSYKSSGKGRIRLVFMGRLVNLKAVDITLRALAMVRSEGIDATLSILGDGESRPSLEALTEELGLNDAVTFHGFLPQAICADHLREADTLILNSVHECGGAVILEAMSLGLPVIGADWGGPCDYLDADTGILVSPVPRESFPTRLADAIFVLANDPDLRMKMGKAGQEKVKAEFDWERKVDKMLEHYETVLQSYPEG